MSNIKEKSEKRKILLRFIHDIFHNETKRQMWKERLLGMMQRLKMASGEAEFRTRIDVILNESKLTNEEKKFCVDHIVEVMKSINVPIEQDMLDGPDVKHDWKTSTDNWIPTELDGNLDKNSIVQYLTKELIHEFNKIDKNNITRYYLSNALNDSPVDEVRKSEVDKLTQLIQKDVAISEASPNLTDPRKLNVTDNELMLSIKEIDEIFAKCQMCDKTLCEQLKLKLFNTIRETLSRLGMERRLLRLNILKLLRVEGKMNARESNNYADHILYHLNSGLHRNSKTPDCVQFVLACPSEPVLVKNDKMICRNSIEDDRLSELIVKSLESFQSEVPKLEREDIRVAAKVLSNAVQARYRFVHNHPRRVSPKAEAEFLKYLILIWMNKMLGRDEFEVLKNTNTLLTKIIQQKVPFKIDSKSTFVELVKYSDYRNPITRRRASMCIINFANTQIEGSSQTIDELFDSTTDYYKKCVSSSIDRNYTHEYVHVRCIYKHYCELFQPHCQKLVKDLSLNENITSKLTKNILNIVWNVYYCLISDPNTNSDRFDVLFEENFTKSIKSDIVKHNLDDIWMKTLSDHVKKMFDFVCIEQRSCMCRVAYLEIMYRDLGVTRTDDRDLLLLNVLDNLILHHNFENKDPFKAYIYKEHAKDGLTEIVKVHTDARTDYIYDKVFHIVDRIGLSGDAIYYEAQAILTRNQFKDWFQTLPLKCNDNSLLQYKMMTILAKNIQVITKITDEESTQKEIEREVIGFLQAELNGTNAYSDIDVDENNAYGANLPKLRKMDRVRFAESYQQTKFNRKSILKSSTSERMSNNCKCIDKSIRRIRGVPHTVGVQVDTPKSNQTNTEHLFVPGCSGNVFK